MKSLYESILDADEIDKKANAIERLYLLDKKFNNINEVAEAFRKTFGSIITKPVKISKPTGFGKVFGHIYGHYSKDGQYVHDNFEVVVDKVKFRFGNVDNDKYLCIQKVYKDYLGKTTYGCAKKYKYHDNFLQWLVDVFKKDWKHEHDTFVKWLNLIS